MIQRLARQLEKEQRDLQVLKAVLADHPIGIVRLSNETGIPEHKVRYSLRMLENDGLVEPTPDGAIPSEDIDARIEALNQGLTELIDQLDQLKTGV